MRNFFKGIFNNVDLYSSLIDKTVNDIQQYFLKIFKKNKKITTKDVLDYLKKNNAFLNDLDDKPKKNTDQFSFTFKDGLESFLFILFLHEMPERFCIEVIGYNDYVGFLLSSNPDNKNIRIKDTYIDIIFKEKPTKLAKRLKDEMIKLPNYIEY